MIAPRDLMENMRYRCPKNGKWVDETDCMLCSRPPKGFHEEGMYCVGPDGTKYSIYYEFCWNYNLLDPDSPDGFKPRWTPTGQDRRKDFKAWLSL